MDEFYIYTKALSVGERYWTGEFTRAGAPCTTDKYRLAPAFDTARDAYDVATEASRGCRALIHFKVGRRPVPVALRSLID